MAQEDLSMKCGVGLNFVRQQRKGLYEGDGRR